MIEIVVMIVEYFRIGVTAVFSQNAQYYILHKSTESDRPLIRVYQLFIVHKQFNDSDRLNVYVSLHVTEIFYDMLLITLTILKRKQKSHKKG